MTARSRRACSCFAISGPGKALVVAGSLLDKVQAKTAGVIADAVKAKVHGKLTQKDGEH